MIPETDETDEVIIIVCDCDVAHDEGALAG